MSLMAIILWALHPLSPWRRYYELARWLLDVLIRNKEDPRTVDWLCAYPDDPRGISHIERAIDDLHAGMDLLIYIRAREILGLKPGRWRRPKPSPPQRRRSRTFNELYARLRACGLRFSQIQRLAQRRAEKLKRLLADTEITLGVAAHAAITDRALDSIGRGNCLPRCEATRRTACRADVSRRSRQA
jgi:hypothetical protein